MSKRAIDLVGSDETISEVGQFFYEWRAGRLSEREYHILTSAHITTHLHDYRPMLYSPCPQDCLDYIKDRLDCRIEYDRSRAIRLGAWFHTVIQQKSENDKNLEVLAWAIGKLSAATGMEIEISKLQNAANRIAHLQFPFQLFQQVLWVKERDSNHVSSARKQN